MKRNWRKPGFMEARGKDYGNAMHTAMQYIHFDRCGTAEGVAQELDRLQLAGFLKEDQRKVLSSRKIADFFDTDLGRKLLEGIPYIREFKFSILDDGRNFAPDLEGEQVLLQGVVDCALLEEDGITVIDFKTDRVTEETAPEVAERYRLQVNTYAEALRRIYEKPVKATYLYFFSMNDFVKLQ